MSKDVAAAIADWLIARGYLNADLPIFTVLYFHNTRYKFTTNAIYKIVSAAFKKVGVEKPLSPYQVRHSAITGVLDPTDGNIRKIKKLSCHAYPKALMICNDNRNKDLWKMLELLTFMLIFMLKDLCE
jgi:integrase/recombinase XerC